MRILVIEDERSIAGLLEQALTAEGYAVSCVFDGAEGELRALSGDFDLVLLDILLPSRSGMDVLRAIRSRRPELPGIMLTAKGETEDKVTGLDLGADDYVTKPFALDELLARVRAHLRMPRQAEASRLDLLAYLMRHEGQVLSRSQILNAVWGYDYDPGTNVLEVYVGYLRRKLAAGDGRPPIETVRGAGYRLLGDRG
jgi:DNA-binding response OmpR family regulator